MMLDTLLVALGDTDRDRIENFADEIERLAGEETTVILFHAFESEEYLSLAKDVGLNTYSSDAAIVLSQRYAPISELRKALPDDVDVRVHGTSTDDVADAIIRAGRQLDADQLLLGGRRRTPIGKATFGSTAQRVLLRADRPVTVIRNDSGSAMQTLRKAI